MSKIYIELHLFKLLKANLKKRRKLQHQTALFKAIIIKSGVGISMEKYTSE